MTTPYRRKLIEVALPLEAINREATRENFIYKGNPSAVHKWWAQRPLAACRAVIFASLVDDPSSRPDLWPTVEAQEKKRQELFLLIEELVKWENSNDERVLKAAREEILRSTDGNPPPVYDPFCGGGSIPLEAQRLGLEAHGSDLNPVPVLITKALIELPPKFAGRPPVNPEARGDAGSHKGAKGQKKTKRPDAFAEVRAAGWKGAAGLAEDIIYYGRWMRDQAVQRIGHLYPKVYAVRVADGTYRHATPEEKAGRKAEELTVIAWLWARTVASPNPAAKGAHVPLVRSFWLSTKAGRKVWAEPLIDQANMSYRFGLCRGVGEPRASTIGRNGGECLLTGSPIPLDYIRDEARSGRMGMRLLASVAEGERGRVYFEPIDQQETAANVSPPPDILETFLPDKALSFRVQAYGMTRHRDLYTPRQLTALDTLATLVSSVRAAVLKDSNGDSEYANAVATYVAFALDKTAEYNCSLVPWYTKEDRPKGIFARQAIPMVWDFAEVNPFSEIGGTFQASLRIVGEALSGCPIAAKLGSVSQLDATQLKPDGRCVYSTDPPYYDNIGYADLSDFFYVWLRRSLGAIFPSILQTMLTPKKTELVATPFRFDGSRERAREFFENGLRKTFELMCQSAAPEYPVTVYYAFKQSESDEENGAGSEENTTAIASTGWETMLEGLLAAGFSVVGTWPMRTERGSRSIGINANALASCIVLVCRPRPRSAGVASRRDFLTALRRELPDALRHLQKGNIAPVDLAQAAIGPGMAIFSLYTRVLENDGSAMGVRTALALINGTLDEVLAEQEGEFDGETRWALAWFDQYGFADGPYGVAETLSTAKNTAVNAMAEVGILVAKAGKVRLLRTDELEAGWDPNTDKRFTIWEATHHLVRALDARGEEGAADLTARLGGARAELARDLSYRLYTLCERRKWAKDALQYNALVQAWPEATRLAANRPAVETLTQREML